MRRLDVVVRRILPRITESVVSFRKIRLAHASNRLATVAHAITSSSVTAISILKKATTAPDEP